MRIPITGLLFTTFAVTVLIPTTNNRKKRTQREGEHNLIFWFVADATDMGKGESCSHEQNNKKMRKTVRGLNQSVTKNG